MLDFSAIDLINTLSAYVCFFSFSPFFSFFLGLPNEGVPLTFCMWDESYSTSDARRMIKTSSTKLSAVIKNKDAVAASVILKSFLRSFHNVWEYLQEYFTWHAMMSSVALSCPDVIDPISTWPDLNYSFMTWLSLTWFDVTWSVLIWPGLSRPTWLNPSQSVLICALSRRCALLLSSIFCAE